MPIRVITYIDGFNLYYGIREANYPWALWLNLEALSRTLLNEDQRLQKVKYFTSIVNSPIDKHERQNDYLEALKTLPIIEIQKGFFLSEEIVCHNCGHKYIKYGEKKTDVNIAVSMLLDAYNNAMDVAILISADSDLHNAVKIVKNVFKKKVTIAFPPKRNSKNLRQVVSGAVLHIGRSNLAKSQFPNQVLKADGTILQRPVSWN